MMRREPGSLPIERTVPSDVIPVPTKVRFRCDDHCEIRKQLPIELLTLARRARLLIVGRPVDLADPSQTPQNGHRLGYALISPREEGRFVVGSVGDATLAAALVPVAEGFTPAGARRLSMVLLLRRRRRRAGS